MNTSSTTPATGGLGGMVCCALGDEQYAFRAVEVRAVARAEQMQPASGRPRVGTLRIGAQVAPVYSLGALFGRDVSRAAADHHIVVGQGTNGPIGLLVDRLVRTPAADHTALVALPPIVGATATSWFEGLLRLDDRSLLVVSPAGVDPDAAAPHLTLPLHPPIAHQSADASAEVVVVFSSPSLPAVGCDHCALGAMRVGAVVQSLPTVRLPGSAPYVRELAWWRDAAVPVIDFAEGARRGAARRFLVLRTGAGFVALPINDDVRLHQASIDDVRVASASDPEYVHGVFRVGSEQVALLDLDALVMSAAGARPAGVVDVPMLV